MLKYLKQTKIQLLIITLLTGLAYSNIFQNDFVIDDKSFIIDWQAKNSLSNIGEFFKGVVPPGHEGVYRPLRSVLYALYYPIFDTRPFGYHLHSILVHLTTTLLVYFIARELVTGYWLLVTGKKSKSTEQKINHQLPATSYQLPFITALLFGLHPIHTETITYISSSMDTIGPMFMFASFYLYLKANQLSVLSSQLSDGGLSVSQLTGKLKTGKPKSENRKQKTDNILESHPRGGILVGSVLSAFAAYFTNETTLVLPLLIILYELCFKKNFSLLTFNFQLAKLLPFILGAALFLVIRFLVLGITSRGPYLADSVYLTALTMTKVFVKYLTLLFWPFNQANNHTIWGGIEAFVYRGYNQDVIKVQSLLNTDILISILILLIIFVVALKAYKKKPLITFGIGWFFISLLPVSEIIPQGSMLGERFLYIPSFGVIIIIAYLFKFAKMRISFLIIFLITTSYLYLTYDRNKDWHDEITFWSKDIKVYPKTNAYAYFQLANSYKQIGQLDLALKSYDQSFGINPHFTVALASKGLLYQQLGQLDQAIPYYQQATTVDPAFWEGYYQLYRIYTIQGKQDLAQIEYQKLLNIYPQ